MAVRGGAGMWSLVVLVVCACHDSGVSPPPPAEPLYSTFTLDRPVSIVDVIPSWFGLTILPEGSQSINIVSMDYFENRLRYAGCATVCDDSTHWLSATIDSIGGDGFYANSGAALTPTGLHVVYMGFGPTVLHAYCPGACQIRGNWQLGPLFFGNIGGNGPEGTPLVADTSGRLHLLYYTRSGLQYAECSGVCRDSTAWSSVPFGDGFSFGYSLATSSSGTNHVVYLAPGLRYATCTTDCAGSGTWTGIAVDADSVTSTALVVAPDSRLHVAYLVRDSVRYATCPGNCTTPGTWQSVSPGRPSAAVALAVRDGTVTLATNEDHVTVLQCSASCLSAASWQSVSVDSARGWGFVALSVDQSGHAVVASTSTSLQLTHLKQ